MNIHTTFGILSIPDGLENDSRAMRAAIRNAIEQRTSNLVSMAKYLGIDLSSHGTAIDMLNQLDSAQLAKLASELTVEILNRPVFHAVGERVAQSREQLLDELAATASIRAIFHEEKRDDHG